MIFPILSIFCAWQSSLPGDPGIYVTSEGYIISLINPNSIWANFDGRYHTAYSLSKVDVSEYQAKYDASEVMKLGYTSDLQISAQYDLLSKLSAGVSSNLIKVPLEIPCVPAPDVTATGDFGTLRIEPNQAMNSLHFRWTYGNGLNDYSGSGVRVGGSEWIDLDGVYADHSDSVSISEQGSGDEKVLVGTATVENTQYKFSGIRVWGRGAFQLTKLGSNIVVGDGWFEWTPSKAFGSKMLKGKPAPSDQMRIYFHTSDAIPLTRSSIRVLKRISD